MKALSKWFTKFFGIGGKNMTKRQRIFNLFAENIGRKFESHDLHATFGSSFRSRVSELNRDPYILITIKNRTTILGDSSYWSEYRTVENDLGVIGY
jgi:hypothetical protein